MPCEGVSGNPLFFFGAPFQHAATAVLADKYTNTTTVPNPLGGADIPPYERFTPDPGGTTCETHHCNPDTAPCSAWLYPFTANVFSHTDGNTVNFAVTRKRGFKNVMGRRFWQGALPWAAPEAGCPTNICPDGSSYQTAQVTASSTKYLTVTYDVHIDNHFDAGEAAGGYFKSDKTGSRTVNAGTGEITSTLSTFEEDATNEGSPYGVVITKHVSNGAGYTADKTGAHLADFDHGGSTLLDTVDEDVHCGFPAVVIRLDGGVYDLASFINAWNAPGNHETPMPLISDPNNYSCSITSDGDTENGPWTVDCSFTRTATSVSWDFTITQNNGIDEINTWSTTGTITLSNANTSASVYADICDNLLSLWPLNDDKLYPFRTDRRVSIAPLVSRNERGPVTPLGFNPYTINDLRSPVNDADSNTPFSGGWTPTYTQMNWLDGTVWVFTFADGSQIAAGTDSASTIATGLLLLFDGSILGAPKPAGYQDFFDFSFQDVQGCCYTDPETESKSWDWYQVGWGMNVSTFNTATGCQLPLNSTQWNNWLEAVNKPIGAWIFYADLGQYVGDGCAGLTSSSAGDSSSLIACKYAEALEAWNSQNFALPAGDMKYWFDETKVYCATNTSGTGEGSNWALIDPVTGTAPPDSIDFSGLWGGPIVGGFYSGNLYVSGIITLGTKIRDLPSNWASKSEVTSGVGGNDSDSCFGKLRFPDCPALLGRIAITPDMAGTIFTFATPNPHSA